MIELTAVVCGIAANFRLLSLQLRLMQADRADAAASAAAAKARMYRSLQLLVFAYVCSKIMVSLRARAQFWSQANLLRCHKVKGGRGSGPVSTRSESVSQSTGFALAVYIPY